MRVFSLCAGEQIRWTVPSMPPKQLIEVGGEKLIERQYRQCLERGQILSIVGKDSFLIELAADMGADFYIPDKRRWTVETMYSTNKLWKGRTIILLGDVFYTEKAMDSIFECELPIAFFMNTAEVFAISFTRKSKMRKHLIRTIQDAEDNKNCKGKLRNLYQNLTGTDYRSRAHLSGLWIDLIDETTDFDLPVHMAWAEDRTRMIEEGLLR